METFKDYLDQITDKEKRARFEEVLNWVIKNYPDLKPVIAWGSPLFTDHGTFIIGFSASSKHLAIAPEYVVVRKFEDEAGKLGYNVSKMYITIDWNKEVNYSFLKKIIDYNIKDKTGYQLFWRKKE